MLGGIGFTFEHDAHLYLRRAMALRSLVGSDRSVRRSGWPTSPRTDIRRAVRVDLAGAEETLRAEVRERAQQIAELPEEDAAPALAEAGFLTPALAGAVRPGRRPGRSSSSSTRSSPRPGCRGPT